MKGNKLCFTDSLCDCRICEIAEHNAKSSIILNSFHYSHTEFVIFSVLEKVFGDDDWEKAILDFIKKSSINSYCYKQYLDLFLKDPLFSKYNYLSDWYMDYIHALIYKVLIDYYGEINDSDNELYLMYLENKAKSLNERQVKHKYIGNSSCKTKSNSRKGQNELRKVLLNYYGKCNITGVTIPEFLEVSHSKPWHQCVKDNDNNELDVYNAFLLVKHISLAYDKGFISFDDNGKILISPQLDDFNKKALNIHDDMTIELEEGHLKFLKYHRDKIFKK